MTNTKTTHRTRNDIELDPGFFLVMAENPYPFSSLGFYLEGDDGSPRVKINRNAAMSLYRLRMNKNRDPLREELDSEENRASDAHYFEIWESSLYDAHAAIPGNLDYRPKLGA